MQDSQLQLPLKFPVQACNAGKFVLTGKGRHPQRTIDSFELIFVCAGHLKIAEEGREFDLRKNQYLILWNRRQHWGTEDYGDGLVFYWLHFYYLPNEIGSVVQNVVIPQYGKISRPEIMVELFRRFLDEQESGSNFTQIKDILATMLLCETIRAEPFEEKVSRSTILADRAMTYIQTHLSEPLSREMIADHLYCNPNYLSRIFRQAYRQSITQAIQERKIKLAAQLFLDTDGTVEEIAFQCGYSDVKHFRNLFKREKGMTPSDYRKMFMKSHINTK